LEVHLWPFGLNICDIQKSEIPSVPLV